MVYYFKRSDGKKTDLKNEQSVGNQQVVAPCMWRWGEVI